MELPSKAFVATVDVHTQKTFTPLCPQELPVPDGTNIVTELNAQAAYAKYRVGSKEAHHPKAIWVADAMHPQLSTVEGENVDIRWAPHSMVGTEGFELIPGLPAITDYDFFVWEGIELDMHPYGVCYHDHQEKLSTGVIEFLRQHDVTHIIVGGLATDYCVKMTVLQLLNANFHVIINLGACRGMADETIQAALAEMRAKGAKLVNTAAELSNKQ